MRFYGLQNEKSSIRFYGLQNEKSSMRLYGLQNEKSPMRDFSFRIIITKLSYIQFIRVLKESST